MDFMSENTIDIIGLAFWYGIVALPILLIPIVWKFLKTSKFVRFLVWFSISFLIAISFYHISLSIIFRDGMGPT